MTTENAEEDHPSMAGLPDIQILQGYLYTQLGEYKIRNT